MNKAASVAEAMIKINDLEALQKAVAWLQGKGEPTEAEPAYWSILGPFIDGWTVALCWDHHDGEIELAGGSGATLAEALEKAMTEYDGRTLAA